jgi:hypothetical protein
MADTSTPQGEIPEETLSQAIDLWLSANPGYACCGKQDRSDLELLQAGEHLYDYQILPIARALAAKDARIGELEAARADAIKMAQIAIGSHDAPGDCFATGPMTGDAFVDYVLCPACAFINSYGSIDDPKPRTLQPETKS